jgi:hypothetical protein
MSSETSVYFQRTTRRYIPETELFMTAYSLTLRYVYLGKGKGKSYPCKQAVEVHGVVIRRGSHVF